MEKHVYCTYEFSMCSGCYLHIQKQLADGVIYDSFLTGCNSYTNTHVDKSTIIRVSAKSDVHRWKITNTGRRAILNKIIDIKK
jgi:hypothetical protein